MPSLKKEKMDNAKENNFYSVVAKITTFVPTTKKLTYQHETKKTQKMQVSAKTPYHPPSFTLLVFRKNKNQKSSSQPLPHAATPDLEISGNSTASELEGDDESGG
jgi:hypothetical protein